MLKPDNLAAMKEFATETINNMRGYLNETAIYRSFPDVILNVTDKNEGCLGGVKKVRKRYEPYIQISVLYITDYTICGYYEYAHIEADEEIGSIEHPVTWKHSLQVVLCHEMAHAVVMMHNIYKKLKVPVPVTYHAYSPDLIPSDYERERKYHGIQWQYVYRELRNEYVNKKLDDYWKV
jgi:hypothetical protein